MSISTERTIEALALGKAVENCSHDRLAFAVGYLSGWLGIILDAKPSHRKIHIEALRERLSEVKVSA